MPTTPSDTPELDPPARVAPDAPPAKANWRRLHPTSLLFSVGSAARGLLIPGAAVLLFGGGSRYEFWLMIFFVPAALFAIVRYFTFRFRLDDEELVVRHGIFTKNERHVPFMRVQNIDLVQNPVHRLLGVATVRIETASGSESEANLQVLSLDAVARMRERVFAGRRPAVAPTAEMSEGAPESVVHGSTRDPDTPGATTAAGKPVDGGDRSPALTPGHCAPAADGRLLLGMSLSEVMLLGAISARGLAIVGAVFGLFWQFDGFEKIDETIGAELGRLMDLARLPLSWQVVGGVVIAVWLALAIQLCSVVWALIRLQGFRLELHGEDLRSKCGLFTQVSGTIPLKRIQVLTVQQTPLMRYFDRVSVRVQTAGARSDNAGSMNRQWVAPLVPRARLFELLRHVQPELDPSALRWEPVHPKTARRLRRVWLIMCVLIAIPIWFSFPRWALALPALILALGWIGVRFDVQSRAFAKTSSLLAYRHGWWFRRFTAVCFAKIQTISLESSPFDRRWRMATVAVDTAGGNATERVTLPYLLPDVADGLFDTITERASAEDFRW